MDTYRLHLRGFREFCISVFFGLLFPVVVSIISYIGYIRVTFFSVSGSFLSPVCFCHSGLLPSFLFAVTSIPCNGYISVTFAGFRGNFYIRFLMEGGFPLAAVVSKYNP